MVLFLIFLYIVVISMRVENLELAGIYFSKWDIPKTLYNPENKSNSF